MTTYLSDRDRIDKSKLLYGIASILVSCLVGYFGQPYIHANKDATDVISSTFAMLAGFLMTALTFVVEPKPGATVWRGDEARKFNFYNRLTRYKWLFVLYLLVLGLIFSASLFSKINDHPTLMRYIEMGIMGFACLAFLLSLSLPSQLMKFQMERYQEAIDQNKGPASRPRPTSEREN